MARARREFHWGTLHKSCPFLYVRLYVRRPSKWAAEVREAESLIMCDAEQLAAEFADARWQRHFVQAASGWLAERVRWRSSLNDLLGCPRVYILFIITKLIKV